MQITGGIFASKRSARLAIVVLLACFVIQIAIFARAAAQMQPVPGTLLNPVPGAVGMERWIHSIPIMLATVPLASKAATTMLIVLALVETCATIVLWRSAARLTREPEIFAAIFGAIALFAPVVTSADLYAYVAYGHASSFFRSVETSALILPPSFHVVNDMYGDPLVANVYGPIFYVVVRVLGVITNNLTLALFLWRAICLASFFGTLALLRGRIGRAEWVVIACCPTLFRYFVGEAHNEVLGVFLLVLAFALVRRFPMLAVVFAAAAAAIKVSFLPVIPTFALRLGNIRHRIAVAGAALGCGALTVWFGGSSSVNTIAAHASVGIGGGHLNIWRATPMAIVVLIVGCAVLFRRGLGPFGFAFALPAPGIYPWYFTWGLPYAIFARTAFIGYMAALPIFATVANDLATLSVAQRFTRVAPMIYALVWLAVVVVRERWASFPRVRSAA